MLSTMNVGIVGCGRAARQHISAIAGLTGVAAAGTFDQDERGIENLPRFEHFEDLISAEHIHAVAFCCPPGTRYEQVNSAISAGKTILLEKPPALNESEHEILTQAADAAGVQIHCMLQHRHRVPYASLNSIGRGPSTGVLLSSRFRPPSAFTETWRADPGIALGGIVAHLGIHYLDIAVEWLGVPTSFNIADCLTVAPGVERFVAGTMTFEGGHTLQLSIAGNIEARTEALHIVDPTDAKSLVDGHFATSGFYDDDHLVTDDVTLLRAAVYRDLYRAWLNTGDVIARCALSKTTRIQKAMDLIRGAITNANHGAA